MIRCIRSFFEDESGANAIEYGLLGALIAIVIVAALTATGTKLHTTYNSVNNGLGSN